MHSDQVKLLRGRTWHLLHRPAEPVWLQDCAEDSQNIQWGRAF